MHCLARLPVWEPCCYQQPGSEQMDVVFRSLKASLVTMTKRSIARHKGHRVCSTNILNHSSLPLFMRQKTWALGLSKNPGSKTGLIDIALHELNCHPRYLTHKAAGRQIVDPDVRCSELKLFSRFRRN